MFVLLLELLHVILEYAWQDTRAIHHFLNRQQSSTLTGAATVGAGHQLLGLARLPVGFLVPQAEVTIVVWDDDAIRALLGC